MGDDSLNAPRWPDVSGGPFHEVWYAVASDPKTGQGLWVRCSAFAEDPDASIDLIDVEGPAGVRVPLFIFRYHGKVHRFAELPWIALTRSTPSAPAWHFSARNSRIAIDGVVRADPSRMVQV